MRKIFLPALLLFSICSPTLFAQESNEDLAKASQNPLANMMSFPFKNNTNFGIGPYDRSQNVLNIQPVLPFFKGKLITRTIIPIVWQPDISSETGGTSGLGDITFTAFYANESKGITWGVGPVVNFPTASDPSLGPQEWGVGPSIVALAMPGKWVVGGLINNVWSVGNESINSMLLQYFINYNLPGGSYITTSPIITSNWNAPDGNQWTVPFGIGAGKIVKLGGKLPLNLNASAYYNVVKPDYGADWTLRLQAVVLLPTSVLEKKK
ncbi:MAG: neuromedin U [Bacteroidetes bacterium]|nr:neuromedin U [Bacteroidota bacterium]